MKKLIALTFYAFIILSLVGQATDFEWEKKVNNIKATIKFLEDKETVIIVPDNNANMRYISQQLPEEYKKDGLKITFTGWEGKIPPNVRMMGKPLKLECICVSKAQQQKFSLKKRSYKFK